MSYKKKQLMEKIDYDFDIPKDLIPENKNYNANSLRDCIMESIVYRIENLSDGSINVDHYPFEDKTIIHISISNLSTLSGNAYGVISFENIISDEIKEIIEVAIEEFFLHELNQGNNNFFEENAIILEKTNNDSTKTWRLMSNINININEFNFYWKKT